VIVSLFGSRPKETMGVFRDVGSRLYFVRPFEPDDCTIFVIPKIPFNRQGKANEVGSFISATDKSSDYISHTLYTAIRRRFAPNGAQAPKNK
jgi:hypothetical protein